MQLIGHDSSSAVWIGLWSGGKEQCGERSSGCAGLGMHRMSPTLCPTPRCLSGKVGDVLAQDAGRAPATLIPQTITYLADPGAPLISSDPLKVAVSWTLSTP